MKALQLAAIIATIAIFGYTAVHCDYHHEQVYNQGKRYQWMSTLRPSASSSTIETLTSGHQQGVSETASSLPLATPIIDDLPNSSTSSKVDNTHPIYLRAGGDKLTRRRLPGDFRMDPAEMSGLVILVVIVLILLCCCRGMLCDILACVCLYEICCDDAAIGGFDLM